MQGEVHERKVSQGLELAAGLIAAEEPVKAASSEGWSKVPACDTRRAFIINPKHAAPIPPESLLPTPPTPLPHLPCSCLLLEEGADLGDVLGAEVHTVALAANPLDVPGVGEVWEV